MYCVSGMFITFFVLMLFFVLNLKFKIIDVEIAENNKHNNDTADRDVNFEWGNYLKTSSVNCIENERIIK